MAAGVWNGLDQYPAGGGCGLHTRKTTSVGFKDNSDILALKFPPVSVLAGVAQWACDPKGQGSIPSQGIRLGCRPGPQ